MVASIKSAVLGFPRIGGNREIKKAAEGVSQPDLPTQLKFNSLISSDTIVLGRQDHC